VVSGGMELRNRWSKGCKRAGFMSRRVFPC